MKMTVEAAYASYRALTMLSQIALPGSVAYQVAKLSRKFKHIAESVDAARESAVKLHGQPVEGKPGMFGLKDPAAFNAEMKSVMEREEEIDIDLDWTKIDPAVLMDAKLPGSIFIDLDWLIRD